MRSIDAYIFNLEEGETKTIVDLLHHAISEASPIVSGTIKWHLPYYTAKKSIGYIHILKNNIGVELNFMQARLFSDSVRRSLDFKDRKRVGGITLSSLQDVNWSLVDICIGEAINVDGSF